MKSTSEVTILTKINEKSVIGVKSTLSTKLITDSSGTISSFTVHQKCFTKFVTRLKEIHTRSKKVKENTKDVVNEPKANTKDGETNEPKANTRDEETNETNPNTKDEETNEAPLVIDEVLESNVSNQDAQESPNASTSLEVVEEEKNGIALDQFHKVKEVSLENQDKFDEKIWVYKYSTIYYDEKKQAIAIDTSLAKSMKQRAIRGVRVRK